MANPALEAFASQIASEVVVAQVLLRRRPNGWRLTHINDRSAPEADLKDVGIAALRDLAQFTETGAFRPLKSAPNLRAGWKIDLQNIWEPGAALDHLYPGFIADWYSIRSAGSPGEGRSEPRLSLITDYREFTARQTGMYRITQHLTDSQASAAIRACCHARFCLKQRLWTVNGLAADRPESKSLIPCLEPCAVMLEFARTAARIEQSPPVEIPSEDAPRIAASLQEDPARGTAGIREADFAAPENPRRLQLALEKIQSKSGMKAD